VSVLFIPWLGDRILPDRAGRNRRGMRATLAAIKRVAEHH
jgi:hypothetical protein